MSHPPLGQGKTSRTSCHNTHTQRLRVSDVHCPLRIVSRLRRGTSREPGKGVESISSIDKERPRIARSRSAINLQVLLGQAFRGEVPNFSDIAGVCQMVPIRPQTGLSLTRRTGRCPLARQSYHLRPRRNPSIYHTSAIVSFRSLTLLLR